MFLRVYLEGIFITKKRGTFNIHSEDLNISEIFLEYQVKLKHQVKLKPLAGGFGRNYK
jgi:hypothetical protein